METLIRQLIQFAIGPINAFVNAFRNSVLRLWQLLVNFFGGGRVAWVWFRQWWNNWTIAHWYGLLSVYEWGRNLVFNRIPNLLGNLSRQITSWAIGELTKLGNFARGLVDQVIRWASQALNDLRNLLRQLSEWATQLIHQLVTDVGQLVRRVFQDWSTPERLTAWLVGAMFRALWRFFLDNVERVSVMLWPLRARIIWSTLNLVERILSRVL